MIKKTMMLLASLACILAIEAQNVVTDTSATCVAYWKKGESRIFSIHKTSRTLEKGQEIKSSAASYEARLTVLDSTENSYTMEWQYQNVKFPEQVTLTERLNQFFFKSRFIYTTTETGAFESLVNLEEIKKIVQESVSEIASLFTNNAEADEARKQVSAIFQSRESIEQLILREIQTYHSPFGIEYPAGSSLEVETELPNFLGGDPFPAVLSLTASKLDPDHDAATIEINQEIDKEKARDIILAFIKKMNAGKKPLPETAIDQLVINDKSRFDLTLSNGWITKVVSSRVVKTDSLEKTDAVEITMK